MLPSPSRAPIPSEPTPGPGLVQVRRERAACPIEPGSAVVHRRRRAACSGLAGSWPDSAAQHRSTMRSNERRPPGRGHLPRSPAPAKQSSTASGEALIFRSLSCLAASALTGAGLRLLPMLSAHLSFARSPRNVPSRHTVKSQRCSSTPSWAPARGGRAVARSLGWCSWRGDKPSFIPSGEWHSPRHRVEWCPRAASEMGQTA
jgi:hypothetical protein